MPNPTPPPEELATAAPAPEPDPGPAPVIDPTPGLEPEPEPNPDPHPEDPDPEPDRDPHPGPPGGPDPDPDVLPRTDPPTHLPVKNSPADTASSTSAAPQVAAPDTASSTSAPPQVAAPDTDASTSAAPQVPEAPPTLVLTARPVPQDKPKPDKPKPARPKKPEEDSPDFPISVIVGKVYTGPLDLLLDLIRKQDIDIYDIPIARITAQFLTYVDQLRATDVDVAGEFIYTASLLIHIKSKMLLPRAPSGPDEVSEDPRRELVERLLEHERFKNAAQMLQDKQMLEAASWTNPGMRDFQDDVNAEPEIAADTTDLVRIFREIMERARKRPTFNVQEDTVTVGQMIQFLGRRLTMEDKPVSLHRLLSHTRSERALVAMFLALLELVRLQAVLLRQDRAFSEIFVKKHTQFDAVVTENLQARDDWR